MDPSAGKDILDGLCLNRASSFSLLIDCQVSFELHDEDCHRICRDCDFGITLFRSKW